MQNTARFLDTEALSVEHQVNIGSKALQKLLEHNTRLYLIDPVMEALGWKVGEPSMTKQEEDAPPLPQGQGWVSAGTPRRIDYHCREFVDGAWRSLLLVEAKRLRDSLSDSIGPWGLTFEDFFCEAIASRHQVKAGMDRTQTREDWLPAVWAEWLDSIIDYAMRIKQCYGAPPRHALLTSGSWYVLFLNVEDTLLSPTPRRADLLIFNDLGSLARGAADVYGKLSLDALRARLPEQHPAALRNLVPERTAVEYVVVVDLTHGRRGERQPSIESSVKVALNLPRHGWSIFKLPDTEEYLPWRCTDDKQIGVLTELEQRRDRLIGEITKHVDLQRTVPVPVIDYVRESKVEVLATGHYRLRTGTDISHLSQDETYVRCPFHTHGACLQAGFPAATSAIEVPSLHPPVFFASGSAYHCAHLEVHEARRERCHIKQFERFFCCRRCIYFASCWDDGGSTLPCSVNRSS